MAITIPARHAAHVHLAHGDCIKVITPSGRQVVDLWAFPLSTTSPPSWMSMAQTRSKLASVRPVVRGTFIDTRREAVLTLVEDTSPGVHDMLFPACDPWRYAEGGQPEHASCAANLRAGLSEFTMSQTGTGVRLRELEETIVNWGWTPEPLNLFMSVPVGEGGKLSVSSPDCKPGDYVVLRAETDCLIVMSACPNDVLDTNGGEPGDAAYELRREAQV